MESVPVQRSPREARPVGVGQALTDLLRHPWSRLMRRWNWKSALLSAAIRGTIFLVASLPRGTDAALRALLVDAVARVPLAGCWGAITQHFRLVEPAWAAQLVTLLIVPAAAHTAEIAVHTIGGTPAIREGVLSSIAFSAVVVSFNLFAMRRGALVTGDGAKPLVDDLRRLPALWLAFAMWLPTAALRAWRMRRGR